MRNATLPDPPRQRGGGAKRHTAAGFGLSDGHKRHSSLKGRPKPRRRYLRTKRPSEKPFSDGLPRLCKKPQKHWYGRPSEITIAPFV
ncbi:hypothetical protein [Neisseria sp. KEM232]|uniref:hypothetical protein n=1 Tax=Neisseria sp. KEM232 TaxID=655307 RepID=UPI0012ED388F|nr:hypothetical protein [Neisseria sp. KEM232]